jgi:hypothetical protein
LLQSGLYTENHGHDGDDRGHRQQGDEYPGAFPQRARVVLGGFLFSRAAWSSASCRCFSAMIRWFSVRITKWWNTYSGWRVTTNVPSREHEFPVPASIS